MLGMNEWDIMIELVRVRMRFSDIARALESYGMPDEGKELRTIARRLQEIGLLVDKHFEEDEIV
jgi:hypothetical protein